MFSGQTVVHLFVLLFQISLIHIFRGQNINNSMNSKDANAGVLENEADAKTKLDPCFGDPMISQTCLVRDESVKSRIISHNGEDPRKIGEILEDFLLGNVDPKENFVCSPQTAHAFCTSADMKPDVEAERTAQRARPYQNITVIIPNTDQLLSSPDITFGQTTLNMVEEFMASEGPRNEASGRTKKGQRGLFSRLFFCC